MLKVLYPFVVQRLLLDPSPKIRTTLAKLIMKDEFQLNYKKLWLLFSDACALGVSRWRLIFDFIRSRFTLGLLRRDIIYRLKNVLVK
jgi:hypothetical protein